MTNTLNKIMHNGDEYEFPTTTYTAGSGISIDQNNEISNTGVTSVNSQTGAVTVAGVPSGGTDGQVLSKVSGSVAWANAPESSNTKTFYLSSTSDLTNAQAALDWRKAGKDAIIIYDNDIYIQNDIVGAASAYWYTSKVFNADSSSKSYLYQKRIFLDILNGVVQGIYQSNTAYQFGLSLHTGVNYVTPYTPEYDGSPATKKYVDDHGVPSGGTDGQVLSKVSGSIAWANAPESSNTKAFYLSSTSDLTTAQAAYDWYAAEKNPILIYNKKAYILLTKVGDTSLRFYADTYTEDSDDYGYTKILRYEIRFSISSGNVTSILNTSSTGCTILRTSKDYPTPYTPQYDGSPATKKYVDDHALPAVGSNGQVLTVVSGAAAWANASGGDVQVSSQANNILQSGMKIRAGEETDYANLGTYDSNTLYLTVPDSN